MHLVVGPIVPLSVGYPSWQADKSVGLGDKSLSIDLHAKLTLEHEVELIVAVLVECWTGGSRRHNCREDSHAGHPGLDSCQDLS